LPITLRKTTLLAFGVLPLSISAAYQYCEYNKWRLFLPATPPRGATGDAVFLRIAATLWWLTQEEDVTKNHPPVLGWVRSRANNVYLFLGPLLTAPFSASPNVIVTKEHLGSLGLSPPLGAAMPGGRGGEGLGFFFRNPGVTHSLLPMELLGGCFSRVFPYKLTWKIGWYIFQ